jgi:hypothetical protein
MNEINGGAFSQYTQWRVMSVIVSIIDRTSRENYSSALACRQRTIVKPYPYQ